MGAVIRGNADLSKIAKKYAPKKPKTVEIGVLDQSVAEYAAYVEYGWAQRVTPRQAAYLNARLAADGAELSSPIRAGHALVNVPRPFLRGTFEAEFPKWQKILRKALEAGYGSEEALLFTAEEAANDVRDTIRNGGTRLQQFARRKPLTMALYSSSAKKGDGTPSTTSTDKPLELSGALLHSIAYRLKED